MTAHKYPSQSPEYQKLYWSNYWNKNPEKYQATLAKKRAKYFEHHAANKKRRGEYYAQNREKAIARAAIWQNENREKLNSTRRAAYVRPNSSRRKKTRLYGRKRIESGKATEYQRAYRTEQAEILSDLYIRQLLAKHSILKPHEFPVELVEAKRMQMKIKQQIKQYEKYHSAPQ